MNPKPHLPLLQVNNWDGIIEKTKSREVDRCSYVCYPNEQDSISVTNILGEADGAAILGIYLLLVLRLSRQPKPREGWLTENGKRDGRRYSIELRSSLFRRAIAEIQRMFVVTTSPDVALIKVVEGSLEAFGITLACDISPPPEQGRLGDPVMAEERADGGTGTDPVLYPVDLVTDNSPEVASDQREGTAPPPQGQRDARIKERKGREVPPAVPQGGQGNDYDEISDVVAAKALICKTILNGKNPSRPWSYQAQQRLAELLPIPKSEIENIAWFRSIPKSDDVPELKARRDPITETTLMDFWGDEVQRAKEYRRKYYQRGEEHLQKQREG
jgi:hypothetical protein